ncbi:hypothetical protein CEXT_430851 [Caerostris extrusa]|uniref:Uncharacterized protein n=1 Tax=Caerostris extrusa TaxID=172846 RepID=A0AAV4XR18_CAEEX|nr:hypothetical protein CEXT_430851 [Caerostris extrusa]
MVLDLAKERQNFRYTCEISFSDQASNSSSVLALHPKHRMRFGEVYNANNLYGCAMSQPLSIDNFFAVEVLDFNAFDYDENLEVVNSGGGFTMSEKCTTKNKRFPTCIRALNHHM